MRVAFLLRGVTLAVLTAASGCSSSAGVPSTSSQPTPASPPVIATGDAARSDRPRDLHPAAAASEIAQLVADNNAYAFDTLARLRAPAKNVAFAPYSLSLALAMTYAGARGATATQMAHALHFSLPPDRLPLAFDALDLALRANAGDTLAIADSLWGRREFPIERAFLDVLATSYGAGLRLADFGGDPDGARSAINAWVDAETRDRIPALLPDGSVDDHTVLVLVNAVDFHADWLHAFDPTKTATGAFAVAGGPPETVDMMLQHASFNVGGDGSALAIDLPYTSGSLAMTIVLPSGDFDAFEATLDAPTFARLVAQMAPVDTDLAMPKLSLGGPSFSVRDELRSVGMVDAFDSFGADFTGMSPMPTIHIQDVFHAAKIRWDEQGAEASGATGVVTGFDDGNPGGVITINRPFIYLIRDTVTGAILFAGDVVTTVTAASTSR